MKRILALAILALAPLAHAQTMSLPAATSEAVTITWTASVSCTASAPCTYAPYRMAGACNTNGSTWTALPATSSQAASAIDSTVTPGSTYSYVVEAVQGSVNSGPSNCVTVTVPNVPAAPTGLSAAG